MSRLHDHFPYAFPRSQQIEIMDALAQYWDQKQYFLIEAPTGTGKSGIAHAIAGWTGSAYVLTETKMLQDQYVGEFEIAKSLKGRSNYTCFKNPAFTAETSPCTLNKHQRDECRGKSGENMGRNICPYYIARDEAFESEMMITNYDFLMTMAKTIWHEDRKTHWYRKAVICDEGHCLEDKVTSHATIAIDTKKLAKRYKIPLDLGPFDDFSEEDLNEFLREAQIPIQERLNELGNTLGMGRSNAMMFADQKLENLSPAMAKQFREMLADYKALDRMIKGLELYWKNIDQDWIVRTLDDGHTVAATPLSAKLFFKKMMAPLGEKVIIMSATLGDPDAMCEELGIDPSEAMAVRVDSPFDPSKSPVVMAASLDLSYKSFNANEKKLIETVDELLAAHPTEKGIIHAGNYAVTKAILAKSKFKSRLIGKGSNDGKFVLSNEELIRQHTEDPDPTVLISPSMHTGVDLRGDLSKFQIIVKLPFMSLGDKRVKKKSEISQLWYVNDVWKKIIQACGRSTRVETDEAITYILDKAVTYQYNKFKDRLPRWFKKRVVWL